MMSRLWLALVLPFLPASTCARDWPRFRGTNGNGIGEVKGFSPRWTEKDIQWKVKLPGIGHSSPIVWGERLFVTCGEEQTGKRILVCMRTSSGEQLWQRDFPGDKSRKHSDNSFASATPAADERHVY